MCVMAGGLEQYTRLIWTEQKWGKKAGLHFIDFHFRMTIRRTRRQERQKDANVDQKCTFWN